MSKGSAGDMLGCRLNTTRPGVVQIIEELEQIGKVRQHSSERSKSIFLFCFYDNLIIYVLSK